MALVFARAAGVATVVPHRTGVWLPLHLFVVGALLLAISGATGLFVVPWSADDRYWGPSPSPNETELEAIERVRAGRDLADRLAAIRDVATDR